MAWICVPCRKSTMKIYRPGEFKGELDFRELTPEGYKEAMALARAAFTAEDLQRYTVVDEEIPMDQLLDELEELQKQYGQGTT